MSVLPSVRKEVLDAIDDINKFHKEMFYIIENDEKCENIYTFEFTSSNFYLKQIKHHITYDLARINNNSSIIKRKHIMFSCNLKCNRILRAIIY